jgi:hypothetical protein
MQIQEKGYNNFSLTSREKHALRQCAYLTKMNDFDKKKDGNKYVLLSGNQILGV